MKNGGKERRNHLMCHRLLGGLPVIAVVGQGDQEQGAPEDQVGHRDHYEHLHLDVAMMIIMDVVNRT